MKKILIIFALLVFMSQLSSCGVKDSGDETRVDGILDTEHRIFITSQSFSGDLGGIEGADAKCRQAALDAGLVRNYKALISTVSSDAFSRLAIIGPTYLINAAQEATLVADSSLALWSSETSSLLTAINVDQNGTLVTATPWTGTTASGGAGTDFCNDWQSSSSTDDGGVGSSTNNDSQWVESDFKACDQENSIYCISQ
jgi:hypothetical protein